jgi:hypothetical protein
MTGSVLLYDPTAPCERESEKLWHALGGLTGKAVGFIDNAKTNFSFLVEDLSALLKARHGVNTIIVRRKRGASMPASDAVIEELAAQCDLVICGSGD